MAPKYFQGVSIHGPVKASPAQTFREVVDAFRICPVLPVTYDDFMALPEKSTDKIKGRDEVKQVPFFVAACFKDSPSKRSYDRATHCNLIFLDIDPEKEHRNGKWIETGSYPAAPLIDNPDMIHTSLAGYNFAAYLTASSTPTAPRMRVVVDASGITLDSYPAAAKAVAALLGLPSITKESKVSVQPMFLPTMFRDSGPDEHPLIAYNLDGRTFTMADIGEEVEDDKPTTGKQETGDHSLDSLFFLRAPVPEITLTIAKEALEMVDPDCSYHEWLEMAAALKHQFSPHKAEEAFTLFDEWSSEGTKYGSEDETRKKWQSLRHSPIGRLPVTIRSLLKRAVASGWDDKKVKEKCFNKLVEWLEDCPTIIELMEQGVHKILGSPLMSAMQEDVLVNMLCAQARKRFAYTIGVNAIRKDIARTKAEMKAQAKPSEKTKEPTWAKGICYIAAAQEFYRHRTGEKYKTESFNASYSRKLLPTEEALKDAGIPVTPATLSKPIVSPTEYSLNHLKIPTVYDYAYDPSQPTDMLFVNRGRKFVNTYSPTYPEPDFENAEEAGRLFQRHLSHLVAEPEYRKTLTDFMAFCVQSPGQKIRWAILIQSVEGAGKTFLAEVMKAVLGPEHVKTIDGTAIKSGWNDWAFGHQLVVLEEVRVTGTNRHEIMNALKPLVTNDDISLNERFRNNRQVQNISNYMMFSNHHDALALTPGDRRYFVIKSPLQNKSQVLSLGENYFPPLYAMLRDKAGAMRAYLDQWEISDTFKANGHAPRTKYVQDLINDTAGDLTAGIRRLIEESDYPLIQYDIVSAKMLMDVLQLEDNIYRVTSQHISQILREEGFHMVGRYTFDTDRHYIWARSGVDDSTAIEVAAHRMKNNLKNLCMDLLF